MRNKENLSFLQNTIPRTGKIASALLHAVCTCEFIPCSQSNEGCVTRFISRANSALELRFFSKLWVAEDDTAGFGAIMRGSLKLFTSYSGDIFLHPKIKEVRNLAT